MAKAVVLWMQQALEQRQETEDVDPNDVDRFSPLLHDYGTALIR